MGLFEEGPALTAAGKAFYALTQEKNWSRAASAYHEAYSTLWHGDGQATCAVWRGLHVLRVRTEEPP